MGMFSYGVDVVGIIKKTTSVKELLLMKKEILQHGVDRRGMQALELIDEQLDNIDLKNVIVELFQHLL